MTALDPWTERARVITRGPDEAHAWIVVQLQQDNLRVLRRQCRDLYQQERAHSEWIDLGGEA